MVVKHAASRRRHQTLSVQVCRPNDCRPIITPETKVSKGSVVTSVTRACPSLAVMLHTQLDAGTQPHAQAVHGTSQRSSLLSRYVV